MPSRERYGVPREEVWVLECGIEYLEVTQRIAEPPSWTRTRVSSQIGAWLQGSACSKQLGHFGSPGASLLGAYLANEGCSRMSSPSGGQASMFNARSHTVNCAVVLPPPQRTQVLLGWVAFRPARWAPSIDVRFWSVEPCLDAVEGVIGLRFALFSPANSDSN